MTGTPTRRPEFLNQSHATGKSKTIWPGTLSKCFEIEESKVLTPLVVCLSFILWGEGNIRVLGLVGLFWILSTMVSWWQIFEKAGRRGWFSLVPFFNVCVLLKIIGFSGARLLFNLTIMFLPMVDMLYYISICFDVAKAFGRHFSFGLVLWLLGPIGYLSLGFGSSAEYVGVWEMRRIQAEKERRWKGMGGAAVTNDNAILETTSKRSIYAANVLRLSKRAFADAARQRRKSLCLCTYCD